MDESICTFTGKEIFPFEPTSDMIDLEDIAQGLANTCRYSGQCQHFFCVTPDTKILTYDFRWIRADEIKTGEELWGCDEKSGGHRNWKKWRKSVAKNYGLIEREVYKISLEDGTEIKCSKEHPILSSTKASGNQKWIEAEILYNDFKNGRTRYIPKFLDKWDEINTKESGWVAGMFDGGGHVSSEKSKGRSLAVSQNQNPSLDQLKKFFNENGFDYRESNDNHNKKCYQLYIRGGLNEQLRLLGSIRPQRLIENFQKRIEGTEFVRKGNLLKITNVEYMGIDNVVALETSTHTYITEGVASHNSVAQHSIYVSYLCNPENALKGLLHDASEAYFTDIPKPIKHRFGDYGYYEDLLLGVIYEKFGLDTNELKPDDIEWADKHIYQVERQHLMPDVEFSPHPEIETEIDFNPWPATWAKERFFTRFNELYYGG